MTASIRPIERRDLGVLCELIRQLGDFEGRTGEIEASTERLDEALFAEALRGFCEVADIDEMVVGYVLWFYTFSTYQTKPGIYVASLFVRGGFRGQGIGNALLARNCETLYGGGH